MEERDARGSAAARRIAIPVIPAKAGMTGMSGEADACAQVNLVVETELAESMHVQGIEKRHRRGIQLGTFNADLRGHAGLVITDAGNPVQQIECRIERRLALARQVRRMRKSYALDQLGAIVEGIDQAHLASRIVTADKAEGLRLAWVNGIHRHTSPAGSRKL